MENVIFIPICALVFLFFLWAIIKTNSSKSSGKSSKSKSSEEVSVPSEPRKYTRPKTIIKKRNLEKDYKHTENKEEVIDKKTPKLTGDAKIEKVFTEPIKREVAKPVKESVSKEEEKDDFEKELDALIAELERETANGAGTNKIRNNDRGNFADSLSSSIDPYGYGDYLGDNDYIGDVQETSYTDDYNFDDANDVYAEQSVQQSSKDIEKFISSNSNIINDELQNLKSSKDDGLPDFDKSSFNERRQRGLEIKDDKNSNIVVLEKNNSRQKAKQNRSKWL